MKLLLIPIVTIALNIHKSFSQSNPIWDVGTKWTYELVNPPGQTSFVTNEIIDTVTIDNLKLFLVASEPVYTGIQYFHYKESKVYNYNPSTKILQLLYDFNEENGYQTDYRPICDPEFDYDSLNSQTYLIEIDSLGIFTLPDGTETSVQYTKNEISRRVLRNIGFLKGYIHNTHDWELGMLICDDLANFVTKLRCFENDSVKYNFQTYSCDSTWFSTTTEDINILSDIKVFPNPTSGRIEINGTSDEYDYEAYSANGQLIKKGKTLNKSININKTGLITLKIMEDNKWVIKKVIIN